MGSQKFEEVSHNSFETAIFEILCKKSMWKKVLKNLNELCFIWAWDQMITRKKFWSIFFHDSI